MSMTIKQKASKQELN